MNEERTRDYLEKSDFNPMQADALAKVLSDVARKDDLHAMELRIRADLAETRAELREAIAASQTEIMRWGIAMIIAMASIFTLLDVFID